MNLYQKLLKAGKEAIEEMQIPFKVREQKKKLELEILQLEQKVSSAELEVEKQKSSYPVNWDKLVNAIDEMELIKRRLKILNSLETEMFEKEVE